MSIIRWPLTRAWRRFSILHLGFKGKSGEWNFERCFNIAPAMDGISYDGEIDYEHAANQAEDWSL
jgi:hypothetical protein